MSIRPAISAPLPWLTILIGKSLGKKREQGAHKTSLRRSLFPRSLRFTKEGTRYTAILFLIGLAAINTGNNLLYLILAMMLSLIIISGLMSESTLRKLYAQREFPSHIFMGTTVKVRISIENKKKYLSSYSFTVEELSSEDVNTSGAYVLKVTDKTTVNSKYTFKKRGVVKLNTLVFKTRFPFGLFMKGRTTTAESEVVVLPRLRPLKKDELSLLSLQSSGTARPGQRGTGSQLYGLRDYNLTDDSRYIHWKASAKSGKLVVKEYEKETEKKIRVVFNNLSDDPKRFELEVEKAASLVNYYITELGYSVGLRTLSGTDIPCASGEEQLMRILHNLALIEPGDKKGRAEVNVESV